ncbi:enoyl-CoA hydratase-related protein, partial [Chloroflexota bacterium]
MRGFIPKYVEAALFRTIPAKLAFDMLLTGENWDARKALAAGLVSRVASHTALHKVALDYAKQIAQWDTKTLEYCKKAAYAVMGESTYHGAIITNAYYHVEHENYNPKALQGTRDFIAKRGVKANRQAKSD